MPELQCHRNFESQMEYEKMIDKQMQTLEEIMSPYMFDTSRRAKTGASCLYLTSDNRKCAVGSMLTDSALDEFGGFIGGVNTLSAQANGLKKLLRHRYKCHATQLDYLNALQGFHDASENWDENGMTNTGRMNLQVLKDRIKAGDYVN